jgi:hypothetical protein
VDVAVADVAAQAAAHLQPITSFKVKVAAAVVAVVAVDVVAAAAPSSCTAFRN